MSAIAVSAVRRIRGADYRNIMGPLAKSSSAISIRKLRMGICISSIYFFPVVRRPVHKALRIFSDNAGRVYF